MTWSEQDVIAAGRRIVDGEAQGLHLLSSLLDVRFSRACSQLAGLAPHARVVTSGIGKAGLIAQKASATLSSIGLASSFLHPTEAMHGDLGRIHSGDVVLLFSNSGETPEVVALLPFVKRQGGITIAICSNTQSALFCHADIAIPLGAQQEAGALGIVPTTSTSAMLAVSDALALTVFEMRGASAEQFARLHPGGALGRALVTVEALMRKGEKLCVVSQETPVRQVVHAIGSTKGRPGAAAITDTTGALVGIFTDGNLNRCLESGEEFLSHEVRLVMGKDPKVIEPHKLVQEALHLLRSLKIDQLVVVDLQRRPVGMLDVQDVLAL
jgi:arabinose-5-phosphate isomerase